MDLFFGLLLTSHLGLSGSYNGFNPYVGVALTDSLSVGAYYNSESTLSTFVSTEITLSESSSIEAGLVTGYSDTPLQPMVKFNYKRFYVAPVSETLTPSIKNVGLAVGIDWRY